MSYQRKSNLEISATQYEDRLAEGDRWIELDRGRLVRFDPPNEVHGDVIRNLSRPLANYAASTDDLAICFELPIVISREEGTIRCPAVSCFRSENRFAETDKLLTETIPHVVIEVASTNDRRNGMSARVNSYLDRGVNGVWVIDPVTRNVHQFAINAAGILLKEMQTILGGSLLPNFSLSVSALFALPKWAESEPFA